MAQIARVTTWAAGQVLTASALNGEFNNIVTAWNNIDSASSAWTKLSVSGTSTLAGAVSITPTSGNPLVVNSTDFVVDSTDHFIGVGKVPTNLIDALLTQNTGTNLYVTNAGTGTGATVSIAAQNSANLVALQMYGTGNTSTLYGVTLGNYGVLTTSSGTAGLMINTNAGSMYLGTVSTKALQIDTSQNVNIPNTKLQCTGNQVFPILQAIQTTSTSSTNSTSNAFADTFLTATITPKFSSSKIFVMASGLLVMGVSGVTAIATLARAGTNLGGTAGMAQVGINSGTVTSNVTMQIYDSPATTSATTYSVQLKTGTNTNQVTFGGATSVILLVEIAQ